MWIKQQITRLAVRAKSKNFQSLVGGLEKGHFQKENENKIIGCQNA